MKIMQASMIFVISALIIISSVHFETVTHVVDGDTVDVMMESGKTERVRLLCVNTPESVYPDSSLNVPMGKVASDYTKKRLDGKDVTLVYGPGKNGGVTSDSWPTSLSMALTST